MRTGKFAVIYSEWDGKRWGWTDRVITRRRTPKAAQLVAAVFGNRREDLRETRYGVRKRSSVDVKRGSKVIWEHPGVIVPSVGELGYSP